MVRLVGGYKNIDILVVCQNPLMEIIQTQRYMYYINGFMQNSCKTYVISSLYNIYLLPIYIYFQELGGGGTLRIYAQQSSIFNILQFYLWIV